MSYIRTYPMQNSAILRLNSERERIIVNPAYQRRGEIWNLEKKQLLIDSILNDYDIPKLYFHALNTPKPKVNEKHDYSIIDGRQRLETIWGFINDDFKLSDDFFYLEDESVNAAGQKYSDLALNFPKLKIRFDSFTLPIICVETDDLDLIEEMFSRLNEAVPLNAAEKRNAIGGPMADCIRSVAEHHFFTARVRFSDKRFQFRETAAKLLFIEYTILFQQKIVDTKKPYLDDMVKQYKMDRATKLDTVRTRTIKILNTMHGVFHDQDHLLRTQVIVPIYYLAMRTATAVGKQRLIKRGKLEDFREVLDKNRELATDDITRANFDYLEFERLNQQGTNDSSSIRERTRILCEFLKIPVPKQWPQE